MSKSLTYWFQNDFSGGENTSVPPDSIAENEVVELYNMLPRRDSSGIHCRTAMFNMGVLDGSISSIFKKRKTDGTYNLLTAAVYPGNIVHTLNYGSNPSQHFTVAPTDIRPTVSANGYDSTWFTDWDGDKVLFSDGETGLWVWGGSGAATRVMDLAAGSSQPAPNGKYLIQHNGRLFMASDSPNGSFCTVFCCGSNDSWGVGNANARYESWSGLSQDSGGSIDVVPYSTKITGLASTFGGIVVFKENSIHLWTYSDAVAPWNATGGAQLDVLYDGIGCISHDSIVNDESGTLFMGIADGSKIGLYRLSGTTVSRLSDNVPLAMRSVLASGGHTALGASYDGYYILCAKQISTGNVTTTAIYDMVNHSWATFGATDVTAIYRNLADPYIMFGASDGTIYKYPSTSYTENGSPLLFRITTRRNLGDSPASDVYYRLARVNGGAGTSTILHTRLIGDSGQQFALPDIRLTSGATDVWEVNPTDTWLAIPTDIWPYYYTIAEYQTEAGWRSKGAQLEVSGYATADTYIDYVALGYRQRTVLNTNA